MGVIYGTAGADSIVGTANNFDPTDPIGSLNSGNDTIYGGDGSDTIDAKGGVDSVYGGNGDDYFPLSYIQSGYAPSLYDGGNGFDTLDYSVASSPLHFGSGGTSNIYSVAGINFTNVEEVIGGSGDDSLFFLFATSPFELHGGAGNDTINGGSAADVIYGGAGNDSLYARAGVDHVYGDDGNDTIAVGTDFIDGTSSGSVYDGGVGEDVLLAREANESVDLTAGVASYSGSSYTVSNFEDVMLNSIASGTDMVKGSDGANRISPDSPSTSLGFHESVHAMGGSDYVRGGSAADTLYGGDGDDTLLGGGGGDLLYGETGSNTYVYESATDSTSSSPDEIFDFESGADRIDLSGLSPTQVTVQAAGSAQTLHASTPTGELVVKIDGAVNVNTDVILHDVSGTPGNDTFQGAGGGLTSIDGSGGVDIVTYAGFAHDYAIAAQGVTTTISGGPEALGDLLTSVENLQFLDGVLTFDTGSTAAQILRLYDSFLGRAPDAAGFQSYLRFVGAGHSFQDMANNAAASPEFANATAALNDTQYITYVYEHSLHREPDPGGLQNYLNALHDGSLTRTSMIVQAAESPEHVALTAGVVGQGLWIPDEKVESLELLYDAAVQRQPDPSGIAGYGALVAGGTTYKAIANQMSQSAEFLSHHASQSDADYVDSLYVAEVGRHADPAGLAAYVDQLAHGFTRGDVLYETAFSQEHQSHVLAFYDPLLG